MNIEQKGTETINVTAKRPWMAVFLSQLLPGAGQIYSGNKLKGTVFVSLYALLFLTALTGFLGFLFSEDATTSRFYALIAVGTVLFAAAVHIYSLFDAHKTARRFNQLHNVQPQATTKNPWLATFLSCILPGIGQFYNRQILKGTALIVVVLIFYAVEHAFYPFFILIFPLYYYSLLDAYESSEKLNGSNQKFLRENKLIKVFVITMLIFEVLPVGEFGRAHIIQAFKIPAGSMLPTLKIGDHVLVNKTPSAKASIRSGDLIVFKYPEDPSRDFIKRVTAVGGNTLEARDKKIYINGTAIEESYAQYTDVQVRPRGADSRDNFGPYRVPENSFFVLGDNRDQSYDSRYWGYVPKENVKGKALKIYWSLDAKTGKVRWNRIGMTIK